MMNVYFFLVFLIVAVCTAEAETLSSNENVAKFVERHIQGYEVGDVFNLSQYSHDCW